MKEHEDLDQTQVSKVTLHFVCGHLSRKQPVVFVKSYEKVNLWHRLERDLRMSETTKISKSKGREGVFTYL